MKSIVNSNWLKDRMTSRTVALFDVRYKLGEPGYGKLEYDKGHIPGAIFLPMEDLLTGNVKEHGGRHPFPNMEEFRSKINELGVDDNVDVVVYDDGELAMSGRLWIMLRYLGKNNVYILQGGINCWLDKGNSLDTKIPMPILRGALTTKCDNRIIADIEDVKKVIETNIGVIIDSRTSDRYRGEIEPIDKIPGHIPTALNYPWCELIEMEELTEEKIKIHYEELNKHEEIFVYCGSGITGTVNMIFLEEAGFKPRLYVGGYSDWVSYSENEIINNK